MLDDNMIYINEDIRKTLEKKNIFITKRITPPRIFPMHFHHVWEMELLLNTDMNVTEISLSCGFHTLPHFMRQFKKKYQITPLQMRKNKNS